MKPFLLSCLTSLLTGLCFAGGIMLALFLASEVDRNRHRTDDPPTEQVSRPAEIKIVQSSRTGGTAHYRIQGVVQNTGGDEWKYLTLEAVIKAGGGEVARCMSTSEALHAHDRQNFEFDCAQISGSVSPDVVSYEVSVSAANKLLPKPARTK